MKSRLFFVIHIVGLGVLMPALSIWMALVITHPEWSSAPGYEPGFNSMHIAAFFVSIPALVVMEPAALVVYLVSATIFVATKRKFRAWSVIGFSLGLPLMRLAFDFGVARSQSFVFDLISTGLFAVLVVSLADWRLPRDFANQRQSS